MGYIAFLDLLGTKDLSFSDSDRYFEVTIDFANELRSSQHKGCNIYCFSDCAYIKSDTFQNIVDCLVQLREGLLKNKVYFTAAISGGDLGVKEFDSSESNLGGCIFTDSSISRVYTLQSSLKGIGILIDDQIKNNEIYRHTAQYIFRNYFIPDISNPNQIKDFRDVLFFDKERLRAYDSDYVATFNDYWSYILSSAIQSNLKSNRFGRYYVSLFINLLASIDFSCGLFSEKNDLDEGGLNDDFRIVNYLLSCEDSHYLQENLIGFSLVYLFMIRKLYEDNSYTPSTFTRLFLSKVLKIKIVEPYFVDMNKLPRNLISLEVQSCLLEDYYYLINKSNAF